MRPAAALLSLLLHCAAAWTSPRPRVSSPVALRAAAGPGAAYPEAATDVFVGNLRYGTDEDYLEAIVRSVRGPDGGYLDADVLAVTVMRNETTGDERGFGFVKVGDARQAADLADGLDGEEIDGRVLNANVKEPRKRPWVERAPVDPATLDDGGLLAALDDVADVFAIQEYGLDAIRNACKKAGIKAGGNLDQCAARLLKIKGLAPDAYKDPALGLVPTRGGRRNDPDSRPARTYRANLNRPGRGSDSESGQPERPTR